MNDPGQFFIYVHFGLIALSFVGVLWSPFAALICVAVARIRGLKGEPWAASGAKHSAAMLLPWFYLLIRMSTGKSLPFFVVLPVYVAVFGIWLVFYIMPNVVLLGFFIVDIVVRSSGYSSGLVVTFILLLIILLPPNVITWRLSIRRVRERYKAEGASRGEASNVLPDGVYLEPFIWLIAWSIVFLLTLTIIGILGYTRM